MHASDVWVSGCVPWVRGGAREVRVGDLSSVSVSGVALFAVYRRVKIKSCFFGPTDRGFSSFFILLVVPSFPFQSGSAGRSLGSVRDSGFFVELALSPARPAAPVFFEEEAPPSPGAPESDNERRWRGQAVGSAAVGSAAIGAVNDDGGTGGRVAPRLRGSNSCWW